MESDYWTETESGDAILVKGKMTARVASEKGTNKRGSSMSHAVAG